MPLELLVVSVSHRDDGISLIGFGPASGGEYRFVRLVAPTPAGILYPDPQGTPRPHDLIQVEAPWSGAQPWQPENRIVDDSPWKLLARPAPRPHLRRLERMAVAEGELFGTPGRSIRAAAGGASESVLYVAPQDVEAVCDWDNAKEKYRARMRFTNGGIRYELPLVDRHCAQILRRRGEGIYLLEQLGCRAPHGLRLIVTLGEPFRGWCYKFVAGILPLRTVTLIRYASQTPLFDEERNPAHDAMERPGAAVARS